MRLQGHAPLQRQRVMMNVEIHLAENREPAFMARPGVMRVIPAWDPPPTAAPASRFMAPPLQYFVMPAQSGPAPSQPVRFVTVPYPPQPPQYLAANAPRPPAGPVAPGYVPFMIPQGQPPYSLTSPYPGQPSVLQPGVTPIVPPGTISARPPPQAFAPFPGAIDPDTPPILPETGIQRPPESESGLDEADFIPKIESSLP
jgi:hypothetical protein